MRGRSTKLHKSDWSSEQPFVAQMGSSAMLSRALAGVGRGQAPNAPGDRSSAPMRQIAVGPPLVSSPGVPGLTHSLQQLWVHDLDN